MDVYFALIPKEHVPKLPLLTVKIRKDRGGQPIRGNDLQKNWQRASRRAGLRQVGLGPHGLRSAFRSQCARVGVTDAVAEFQMGHGGRDKYGYSRETTDETYNATELAKLWTLGPPRDEEIRKRTLLDMVRALYPEKAPQVEKILRRVVSAEELAEQVRMLIQAAKREGERRQKERLKGARRRRRPTAPNGGEAPDAPYETRIVGEEELVPLLNEGWDVVKELTSGRIIVRRPND